MDRVAKLVGGITDQSLVNHRIDKTYTITGITTDSMKDKYGGVDFDIKEVMSEFQKICPDFLVNLPIGELCKANEFCGIMLFDVGPAARQVKRKDGDKSWKFIFDDSDGGKILYVCTYKNEQSSYSVGRLQNRMVLSVKQASLLAVLQLNLVNEKLLSTGDSFLLTPLAGAIFSKADIPNMASRLQVEVSVLVREINSSCQTGGQYITSSTGECAAVAALVATKGLKDKNIAQAIVSKTIRQHYKIKPKFDIDRFKVLSCYGYGGIPSSITHDTLKELMDQSQKFSMRQKLDAVSESVIHTRTDSTDNADTALEKNFVSPGSSMVVPGASGHSKKGFQS